MQPSQIFPAPPATPGSRGTVTAETADSQDERFAALIQNGQSVIPASGQGDESWPIPPSRIAGKTIGSAPGLPMRGEAADIRQEELEATPKPVIQERTERPLRDMTPPPEPWRAVTGQDELPAEPPADTIASATFHGVPTSQTQPAATARSVRPNPDVPATADLPAKPDGAPRVEKRAMSVASAAQDRSFGTPVDLPKPSPSGQVIGDLVTPLPAVASNPPTNRVPAPEPAGRPDPSASILNAPVESAIPADTRQSQIGSAAGKENRPARTDLRPAPQTPLNASETAKTSAVPLEESSPEAQLIRTREAGLAPVPPTEVKNLSGPIPNSAEMVAQSAISGPAPVVRQTPPAPAATEQTPDRKPSGLAPAFAARGLDRGVLPEPKPSGKQPVASAPQSPASPLAPPVSNRLPVAAHPPAPLTAPLNPSKEMTVATGRILTEVDVPAAPTTQAFTQLTPPASVAPTGLSGVDPQTPIRVLQTGLPSDELPFELAAIPALAANGAGTGTAAQLTPPGPPAPQAATAQNAAAQMAAAMQAQAGARMPDQPIEIALDPPELGRVRMVFSHVDGGLVLAITADRPETLDLMRRHADLLAREFSDAGLGGTAFSFQGQQNGDSPKTDHKATRMTGPGEPHAATGPQPRPGPRAHDGALDLRL
ncbi:MAG: flagellar hook-length control protein FliK [Roseicyclus sp.]|nr:flagellar hook-length control protein FliK [Roseicyclus sp.]MBO6625068.1 flagellar hook-length control protein FliK [Roseicyclus sp.]MBO6923541.1 flagellar hook-length control protein FliK [Roseicyclus sp.]